MGMIVMGILAFFIFGGFEMLWFVLKSLAILAVFVGASMTFSKLVFRFFGPPQKA